MKRKLQSQHPAGPASSIGKCFSTCASLFTIVSLGLLAACSGSGGSADNAGQQVTQADIVPPLEAAIGPDLDAVSAATLSPIDAEKIERKGLVSAVFNAELDCSGDMQLSLVDFDSDDSTLSTVACDGTQVTASYTLLPSAILIASISLDGVELPERQYELWGLLPEQGEVGRYRACYYFAEGADENAFGAAPALPASAFVPDLESLDFDCSAEAWFFDDESIAESFIASAE